MVWFPLTSARRRRKDNTRPPARRGAAMSSPLVSKTCPKCRGRLYEQLVNGIETRVCSVCKYKVSVSPTARAWEPPVRRVSKPAVKRRPARRRAAAPAITTASPLPVGPGTDGVTPADGAAPDGGALPSQDPAPADSDVGPAPIPDFTARTASEYAAHVRGRKDSAIVHEHTYPAETPRYAAEPLDKLVRSRRLRDAVGKTIDHLYEFQADAITRIRSGSNVVVTASTASGKTMAFLIPVMDEILRRGSRRKKGVLALFLYPTKALASDQIANIGGIAEACGVSAKQLDGSKKDPGYRKALLDDPPDILATNFDFVSYHLARSERYPSSAQFCRIIDSLRFVVVDEAHQYTGFFGANVSWIVRRLARLNPGVQLVASSATMDDPVGFCKRLFSADVEEVAGSGNRGPMTLQLVRTESERKLMTDLTRMFALDSRQTLAFARSRKEAEVIGIDGSDSKLQIHVHRSGITDERRAIIESGLRSGSIRAVACTPTLEVGINLGKLDAVVSSYAPHPRLLQRIGRAGRKGQASNAVMVLDENSAIPGYYAYHPDQYLADAKSHGPGMENPTVDEKQLVLMALDRPIAAGEMPAGHKGTAKALARDGLLEAGKDGSYRCTEKGWEAVQGYSIRDIGSSVTLLDATGGGRRTRIGQVEIPLAYYWLHPGALYFHDRRTYRSISLNKGDRPAAILRRVNVKSVTTPVVYKSARMERMIDSRAGRGGAPSAYGRVRVYHTISGYYEKSRFAAMDKAVLHEARTKLKFDYATTGAAFRIAEPRPKEGDDDDGDDDDDGASPRAAAPADRSLRGEREPLAAEMSIADSLTEVDGAVHGAKHLLAHAATMITGASPGDIAGMIDAEQGIVMLYDNSMNGGNGFSKAIFERQKAIIKRAAGLVKQCPCRYAEGCPRCTQWEGCSHFNKYLDKKGAAKILQACTAG